VCCQSYLGLCRWHAGSPAGALAECGAAVALARRVRQPASLAHALFMTAWIHLQRFDADAAAPLLEELGAMSERDGLPYWQAMTRFFLAWAMSLRGEHERALNALEEGRALCRPLGARVGAIEYRLVAADLHVRRSEPGTALALVDEAATLHAESGERYLHADILVLRASALLGQDGPDDSDAAVACLNEAIDFAAARGLRPIELRAGLLLAIHWEARGELGRARAALTRCSRAASGALELPEARFAASKLQELAGPGA
jgi:hypothetical protein